MTEPDKQEELANLINTADVQLFIATVANNLSNSDVRALELVSVFARQAAMIDRRLQVAKISSERLAIDIEKLDLSEAILTQLPHTISPENVERTVAHIHRQRQIAREVLAIGSRLGLNF